MTVAPASHTRDREDGEALHGEVDLPTGERRL